MKACQKNFLEIDVIIWVAINFTEGRISCIYVYAFYKSISEILQQRQRRPSGHIGNDEGNNINLGC